MAFAGAHPNSRTAKGFLVGVVGLFGGGAAAAVVGAVIYVIVLTPFSDMEHYIRVRENPVTVTATVTQHKIHTDDDDTEYRSYITYTYDGVRYSNMSYENKSKKANLTPVGTKLSIQVSPEDPSQQIAKLKKGSMGVNISVVMAALILAVGYTLAQKIGLTKKGSDAPDQETIRNDLKIKVRSRLMRPFLMLCGVGFGLLDWRYSAVLGQLPLGLAAACAAGWLYCLYTTTRDYRRVENDEFELRQDVLTNKWESSDSDGTTYTLVYKSNEQTWQTTVNAKIYCRAAIGDMILAAYFPGKKRPVIYYNLNKRNC